MIVFYSVMTSNELLSHIEEELTGVRPYTCK